MQMFFLKVKREGFEEGILASQEYCCPAKVCSSSHTKWKVKVKLLSRVWLFVTPWTVAHQAPPSMKFFRQEYWSGLPFPSPGDLPDPGIEPRSPALQADTFTIWATGEAPSHTDCHPSPQTWTLSYLCRLARPWSNFRVSFAVYSPGKNHAHLLSSHQRERAQH